MSKIGDFFRALVINDYEDIDNSELQDFLAMNPDSERRVKDFERRLQVDNSAKKTTRIKHVIEHVTTTQDNSVKEKKSSGRDER